MSEQSSVEPSPEESAEAFRIGEFWAREVRPGRQESDEDEEVWFGNLARNALRILSRLRWVQPDGSLASELGESPSTLLRFGLFDEILGFLGYESYGWVSALDEYGSVAPSIGDRLREAPRLVLREGYGLYDSACDMSDALDRLLGGFRERLDPSSMGDVLRFAFVASCKMLIAIELSLGSA